MVTVFPIWLFSSRDSGNRHRASGVGCVGSRFSFQFPAPQFLPVAARTRILILESVRLHPPDPLRTSTLLVDVFLCSPATDNSDESVPTPTQRQGPVCQPRPKRMYSAGLPNIGHERLCRKKRTCPYTLLVTPSRLSAKDPRNAFTNAIYRRTPQESINAC